MNARLPVLVTDGQDRAGLAGVRSLSAAGYEVDAVAYGGPAAAHWSRHCGRRLTVTDPRQGDGSAFAEDLADVLAARSYAAVVTASDASLLAVSRHRARLEPHVDLRLPATDVVERCVSKEGLIDAAAAAGLDSPPSVVCADRAAALAAARRLGYPALLKSTKPVVPGQAGMLQPGGSVVGDDAELIAALPRHGDRYLLQARTAGPVLSFSGVFAEGALLAYGMSRYARTWAPDAGMASFAETVAAPPGLPERVVSLVADLGWEGVFELELIECRDGSFAAIDFNPRLFGSLELITMAGAPLATIWCDRMGGMEPTLAIARPGYRYRWEEGELRFLWRALRERRLRLALGVLRPARRVVRALFRAGDPGPLPARLLFLLRHRFGAAGGDVDP